MKHPKRRIETVRVGNAAVKIYRRTRTVDGNRYPTFEVCDYTGGRRRLRSFADHQAARREAQRIAGLLANGDAVAAAPSGQEAASFARCIELLRAVGDSPEPACAAESDPSPKPFPCIRRVSPQRTRSAQRAIRPRGCTVWGPSYGSAMSYQTLEVELEGGRVRPRGAEVPPDRAHALLTILQAGAKDKSTRTQGVASPGLSRFLSAKDFPLTSEQYRTSMGTDVLEQ